MWEVDHHTADVRLRGTSPALEELFAEAVMALAELMEPGGAGEPLSREITLEARDTTSLLVDFLNEVLTLMHIEHAAFGETRFASLSETGLRATISGTRVESFDEDVKSVTYHEAHLARDANGWTVTLVLDI